MRSNPLLAEYEGQSTVFHGASGGLQAVSRPPTPLRGAKGGPAGVRGDFHGACGYVTVAVARELTFYDTGVARVCCVRACVRECPSAISGRPLRKYERVGRARLRHTGIIVETWGTDRGGGREKGVVGWVNATNPRSGRLRYHRPGYSVCTVCSRATRVPVGGRYAAQNPGQREGVIGLALSVTEPPGGGIGGQ